MNNNIDDEVEREIERCLDLESPRSFFLFAGAGSGKTRSLVNALNYINNKYRNLFLSQLFMVFVGQLYKDLMKIFGLL